MSLLYVLTNLINIDTLDSVTSEDTTYVKEYLYNIRPSLPFRFTAKTGNQVKVDLGGATQVTFVGCFNHNLLAPTQFKIKAAAADPPGGGNWDLPDYEASLSVAANFNNSFLKINKTYQFWVLDTDDGTSPKNTEIGELVLGQHQSFASSVHLQPRRADGPIFYMDKDRTHYGQPHTAYHAEAEGFSLAFMNINDPSVVDEIHVFLKQVQQAGGSFIIIPDDVKPFCYYVSIENLEGYANRLVYGTKELREWRIELTTLAKGIELL